MGVLRKKTPFLQYFLFLPCTWFFFFQRNVLLSYSYHTIHPFKVYKSVVSGIFIDKCDHHKSTFGHFHDLQKKPRTI